MSATPARDCDAAALAASLFAVDPIGLGGIAVHASACDGRNRFVAAIRAALPAGMPVRKIPSAIDDDRLLGGLDLAATLRAGRPILARGVLAETDGGVIVVPSAERMTPSLAAKLGTALDDGSVAIERDGLTERLDCRLGLILLDEGIGPDEGAPDALLDRVALHAFGVEGCGALPFDCSAIASARAVLPRVEADDSIARMLAEAALAFGVHSSRAWTFVLRVARTHAALNERRSVTPYDAAVAARLVLAPRATLLPAIEQEEETPPPPDPSEQNEAGNSEEPRSNSDMVLEAVRAAIPPGLLERIGQSGTTGMRGPNGGRSANLRVSLRRGRPAGIRAGDLKPGVRLNLVETLKAAAPWQRLRGEGASRSGARVQVRREDFRIVRFKQPSETLTIFVVDASGSSAFHRLAEAKGAVELLLADCYVRRDQVALLAFRGQGADLLLPPTRSLTRAKRSLAELPAGGATPLAHGIDQACVAGQSAMRRGQTPLVVLLTDGRANIGRDGCAGREHAEADALAAGRMLRSLRINAILLDTSQHPNPAARRLADEMQARYVPLPRANAAAISGAVQSARDHAVS
ncbi:MAG: magnesium chelatase subunit D [Pseudorhodoplanes sp.]